MKILVVDDIEDNRFILEELIKRYSQSSANSCEIFSACNGQEAVDIASKDEMDLIFMDINMPIMNGLEATKIIKKSSPTTMIIVVSSESDEEIKVEILKAGAEDYITKPFSPAILLSRLANYHKLILSRNTIAFQARAVNTFTHSIYSYQTKFYISNDDELAQFWETMLMRFEYQNHILHLSDFVRFLYHLGSYQVQKSYKCHIYLEEDTKHFYFTMDNMELFTEDFISGMIEKYCRMVNYEIKGNYLSFVLPKVDSASDLKEVSRLERGEGLVERAAGEAKATIALPLEVEELQTFDDILDEASLGEFEHIPAKLKTEVSMMGSSALEMDDIDTINEYLKQLGALLSISQDAFAVAEAFKNFSHLLDESSREFLAMSEGVAPMVQAFINDIIMWKDMVFYTGAPSVDFLNSSIGSSVEMIRAVVIDDPSANDDVDDIFDF